MLAQEHTHHPSISASEPLFALLLASYLKNRRGKKYRGGKKTMLNVEQAQKLLAANLTEFFDGMFKIYST